MAIVNQKQLKKGKSVEFTNRTDTLINRKNLETEFLSKAEDYSPEFDQDLTKLSLDELANQYIEIDRQSHILKGNILLEARSRFPSDKEFGKWISTHSLCVGSQQSRNRLMHLAEFFSDDRDMNGIPITVAYEISAPINREKALDIYNKIHGKNISVKEIKALIAEDNNVQHKNNTTKEASSDSFNDDGLNIRQLAIELIDTILCDKSDEIKLKILKEAISYIKRRPSKPQ